MMLKFRVRRVCALPSGVVAPTYLLIFDGAMPTGLKLSKTDLLSASI